MKKSIKKIIAICLAVITVAVCFAACSGNGAKTYKVGICQIREHDALNAATEGFKKALEDKLGADNVTFDSQNAQGETTNCSTIVNQFVSQNVDLIMANATPVVQAAVAATKDIPIVGTSVTEYGVALGIDNFTGKTGTNVTGTSDLAPLKDQAAMIKEICPDTKTVGIVYCSAEPNSKYQATEVAKYLGELGITATEYAFADSNDLQTIATKAVGENDALYVPTDNTVADNTSIIDAVARPAKKPVFAGEEGIASGCGVATLTISYYDIGYAAGEMAAQILTEGKNPAEMEIGYAPKFTKKYNADICSELGITVPDDYVALDAAE
ncbi:MAG: ABC transporter substrate-binding protein [Eubacterium sp.]|nr:ABC transporter substrate-binding protein [Eubacterium sp.]MDE6506608.1 ABC transporter substrate-binding protein [Eubacterium sp.]